ncbi:hypothetical protein [Flavobacterium sp. ZB4P13]|uniref:hypothetical protein n=1 Tax=Flavobacterium sp. ZB4P13 TaxID=3401728 RepID=UPI003AB09925
MNKEVVIIGGGILGGMVSNGASTLLPQSESPLLNIAVAGASIFGATKVTGTTTKANLLKGALVGSAIVQALIAVKKLSTKSLGDKFAGTGKTSLFAKGAFGLACPYEDGGLNGQFMGADGNVYEMDESGLSGTFMDENGNVFEAADGLNGADSIYGQEEELGLNGAESELEAELYS